MGTPGSISYGSIAATLAELVILCARPNILFRPCRLKIREFQAKTVTDSGFRYR